MRTKWRVTAAAVVCALLSVVAAPAARVSASDKQPPGIAGNVAATLITELAKTGIKAGIAYFAPDMVKYSDPTAYQLTQIQQQLEQIQNALSQLSNDVQRLDLRLACENQVQALAPIVSRIKATAELLLAASRGPTPTGRDERLKLEVLPSINELTVGGAQGQILRALSGRGGQQSLISACGQYLETVNGPVLTPMFSAKVQGLFDDYAVLQATLLMLRVNYMHYYPDRYSQSEVQSTINALSADLTVERYQLKPAVPSIYAIDLRTNMEWRLGSFVRSNLIASGLRAEGFGLSGYGPTPTCGDIIELIHGFSDSVALHLHVGDHYVRCHNGYGGSIDMLTRSGAALSLEQELPLKGMAAKTISNAAMYSYTS